MNKSISLILALTLIATFAYCAEADPIATSSDKKPVVLTDKTLAEALKTYPKMFVKFYAPWCGHCKALAPKWKKLANNKALEEAGITIAKLDADKHTQAGQDHKVIPF
jgi:thiol-disulfide isomerase/thioredoxin